MSNHTIVTSDMYEGAYLLTQNAKIQNVSVIPESSKLICQFSFSGENLLKAQNLYFNAKAEVNLWDFRRCFNHINSLVGTARKEYKQMLLETPVK